MRIQIIILLFFMFLLGCNSKEKKDVTIISDEIVSETISILRENSIESHKINWDSLELQLNLKYPEIANDSIRKLAINWILKEYQFRHHFFMPSEMVKKWEGKSVSNEKRESDLNFTYPIGKMINEEIGYVSIPTFSSGDSTQLTIFAQKSQQELRKLINMGAKNWVVDLTDCQGGNMWPMLAGIGPLIGKGKTGSFFYH